MSNSREAVRRRVMSEAPKRIWLLDRGEAHLFRRGWVDWLEDGDEGVEYIRADIAEERYSSIEALRKSDV